MEYLEYMLRVFEIVQMIPKGKVSTYGDIAKILGNPRQARYVGHMLHRSPGMAGGIPCHRVVFAQGNLAPSFAFGGAEAQRKLLEQEGVIFLPTGKVDMKTCRWDGMVQGQHLLD